MKLTFNANGTANTTVWLKNNEVLKEQLKSLAAGEVSEREAFDYISYIGEHLTKIKTTKGIAQFLAYDSPEIMPSDARIDFVYTPTYIVATFMMTAMVRFESIRNHNPYRDMLKEVLTATIGKDFLASGYDRFDGLIETFEIFAIGDTIAFINEYPQLNVAFTKQFNTAIEFIKSDLCTGKSKNTFSGEDFTEEANALLRKLKI